MTTTDEAEFEAACRQAIAECAEFGYTPTAWIAMLDRWGAAEAARRLMVSGDVQYGFERLILQGRPELTVEYAVLQPSWRSLFRDDHRAAARWRLSQAGYENG
ncbi:MAG: hypothetical protein JJU45_07395 [Acidimicrobiia bacterium]|nr:hypothetical protein [Acidimicrobiia bacterium]